MKHNYICLTFIASLFFIKISAQTYSQKVEVEINNGGLHCPFLGPKFQTTFSSITKIKELQINRQTSKAKFVIIDPSFTRDSIVYYIVKKAGYPEAEIKSINMDSK